MNWDKLKAYMQNPDIAWENMKRVVPSEEELLIGDRELADKMSSSGKATLEEIANQTKSREMAMAAAGMSGSIAKAAGPLSKGVEIAGQKYNSLKEALLDGITESAYTNAKQLSYRPDATKNFGKVIDLTRPANKLDTKDIIKAVNNEGKQVGNNIHPTLKDAVAEGVAPSQYSNAKQGLTKELSFPVPEPVVPEPKFSNLQKLLQKEKEAEFGSRPEIIKRVSDAADSASTEDVIKELSKNRREALKQNESPDDLTQIIDLERRGLRGK